MLKQLVQDVDGVPECRGTLLLGSLGLVPILGDELALYLIFKPVLGL